MTEPSTTTPPPRADRRAIHAYISEESFNALHLWSLEAGVTVSALIDAMGREVAELAASEEALANHRPGLIKAARKIAAANRRRGGRASAAARRAQRRASR